MKFVEKDDIKKIEDNMCILISQNLEYQAYQYLDTIPSKLLDRIDERILLRFVELNTDSFKKYNHKLSESVLLKLIENKPILIKYVENPSLELQEMYFDNMTHSSSALFFINNPHDNILLRHIEKLWNESVYEFICERYTISDYVHREVNKLKLEKGPMTQFKIMDDF